MFLNFYCLRKRGDKYKCGLAVGIGTYKFKRMEKAVAAVAAMAAKNQSLKKFRLSNPTKPKMLPRFLNAK
ncbi:MAG: hypothetical protein WKF71_19935 [Pyrinomonadaceae bacterium]